MRTLRFLVSAAMVTLLLSSPRPEQLHAACNCSGGFAGPGGPLNCNVDWFANDSLAACPAGDTVIVSGHPLFVHPHPSKLRVWVRYEDANCNLKSGVPPESIWVQIQPRSGNVKLKDVSNPVFADDSTNANGETRITVSGFSGWGKIRLTLFVSGVNHGYTERIVRTTDGDGDGRTESIGDLVDINYDGNVDVWDSGIITFAHLEHWHRNVLHGTLVRRTNFCETCEEYEVGTKGEGEVAWSPSQKYVAYTAFVSDGGSGSACKVFVVPSDPKDGNGSTQISFLPAAAHDYDPIWSPNNREILYDRSDSLVLRRLVPWIGSTEFPITASSNCGPLRGDTQPAISPNGRSIAFTRCNAGGGWSLWKINIDGTGLVALTSPSSQDTDYYPQWSPDGATIYFQRRLSTNDPWAVWKVPAAGGTVASVFVPPSTHHSVQPALSPDGAIMVTGFGAEDELVRKIFTHTLDPALPSPDVAKMVINCPDTNFAEKGDFPILSPRLSPDGTRLLLGSKQVWAARRRMNLPPKFTSVTSTTEGTRALHDTTATMPFSMIQGSNNTIQVVATDPESDPRTYHAKLLQPWMSWNAGTGVLTCSPPVPSGGFYFVKFMATTPSGGTDAFIAEIEVEPTLGPGVFGSSQAIGAARSPNPTDGFFWLATVTQPGVTAHLAVFDVGGRMVATVRAPTGGRLIWDGRDRAGQPAPSGIYLWRLEAGVDRREGKVVMVR